MAHQVHEASRLPIPHITGGPFGMYFEERIAPPGFIPGFIPENPADRLPEPAPPIPGADAIKWLRSSVGAPNPLAAYGIAYNPNDPKGPPPASLPGFDPARRSSSILSGSTSVSPYQLPFDNSAQLIFDQGRFSRFEPGLFGIPASHQPAPENLPQWRVTTNVDAPGHGGFGEFWNRSAMGAILKMVAPFVGGAALNALGPAIGGATGAAVTSAGKAVSPIIQTGLTATGAVAAPTLSQVVSSALSNIGLRAALGLSSSGSSANAPAATSLARGGAPAAASRTAGTTTAASSRTRLTTALANLRKTLEGVRTAQARRRRPAGGFA